MADVFDLLQAPGKVTQTAPKRDVFDTIQEAQTPSYTQDPRVTEALQVPPATLGDKLAEGYYNTAQGLNLLGHYITQKLGITSPEASQKLINDINTEHAETDARRAQGMKTVGGIVTGQNDHIDPGFNWWRLPGEMLPFMGTGGFTGLAKVGDAVGTNIATNAARILPGKAANLAPYLVKPTSMATQGAIASQVAPVTPSAGETEGDARLRAAEYGGAFGAALPPAVGAVKGVWNAGANLAAPWVNPGKIANEWFQNNVPNDILTYEKLKNPTTYVEGSKPTAAMVLGIPAVSQMENGLLKNPDNMQKFLQRTTENNEARLSRLTALGGTDAELQAAKEARDKFNREQRFNLLDNPATSQPVDVGSVLDTINQKLTGPEGVNDVTRAGLVSAKNALERALIKPKAAPDVYDETGFKLLQPTQPPGPRIVPAAIADEARQNLRQFLSDNATNSVVSSKQQGALNDLQPAITQAIEGANPGYSDYLAGFRTHSQPINDMETVREILANFGGRKPNAVGDVNVPLGILRNALTTAGKKEFGLHPDTQSAIEGMIQDLQREAVPEATRGINSATQFNFENQPWINRQIYGAGYSGDKLGAPAVLGALSGGLGGLLTGSGQYGIGAGAFAGMKAGQMLGASGAARVRAAMADRLLNPEMVASAIKPQEKAVSPLAKQLASLLPPQVQQLGLRVEPSISPGAIELTPQDIELLKAQGVPTQEPTLTPWQLKQSQERIKASIRSNRQ